jgi:hypothetical protein
MPTNRQKKVVEKILEKPCTMKEAILESGYSANTAHNPKDVTESKGFKEALKEYGLTEELITCSLVEDIKAKPKNRLGELRLGSEILKMKEDDSTYINIHNYTDEQSKRIAERALQSRMSDGEGESN